MKRNKKRYVSKGNQFPRLVFSGNVYLKYEDEEALDRSVKGDVFLYLSSDSAPLPQVKGDYHNTGHAGFFKGAIFDGKHWHPFSIQEFFEGREQYYTKHERPIDTWNLCAPLLRGHKGVEAIRTYREHYEPVMGGDED